MLCKLFKHYFIQFKSVYLCVLTLELQSTRKIYCLNDGNLMPQMEVSGKFVRFLSQELRKGCQMNQSKSGISVRSEGEVRSQSGL